MANRKQKTDNPLLKECFFTALILLMEQKDFKDITISEIAKKSGVSRMTYYRTYSSKEDILIQYFDDHAKKLISQLEEKPDVTAKEVLVLFFSSFNDQAHLLHDLYQAGLMTQILERFTEFISYLYKKSQTRFPDGQEQDFHIHFIAGGIYTMLLRWQEAGRKETPEEMAALTVRILFGDSAEDR